MLRGPVPETQNYSRAGTAGLFSAGRGGAHFAEGQSDSESTVALLSNFSVPVEHLATGRPES